MNYDGRDLECVAKTLWGEARGEPRLGQIAVVWVIRNRASLPAFAGTLAGGQGAAYAVCRSPWQFSCWNEDDPNCAKMASLDPSEYAAQSEIAMRVFDGEEADPTGGAVNYYAVTIPAPSWAYTMKMTTRIGNHAFYAFGSPPHPLLLLGSTGPDVAFVQDALRKAGVYQGASTGLFDVDTYDAVRRFQAGAGLTVDGRVGQHTYAALGIK